MKLYSKLSSIFLVSFCLSVGVKAQVTIGVGKPAVPGALLQLKENDSVGANSTRGLMLPRVQLTGHDLDLFETDPTDTNEMYIGLTVWNIRGVNDICKGVNVWTGTRWVSIPKRENLSHYDPSTGILTDHEGNSYPTGEFEEAGRWMTVNLRTKSVPGSCEDVYYPDELTLEQFRNNMEIRAMMYPNGRNENRPPLAPDSWFEEQGMLYTWALATDGKGGEDGRGNIDNPDGSGTNIEERDSQAKIRQGICPNGWHLPSLAEWKELFVVLQRDAESTATDKYADYTTANPSTTVRGGGATIRSKVQLSGGVPPNGASKSAWNGGFDMLMTGYKISQSDVPDFGKWTSFWTASSSAESNKQSHSLTISSELTDLIEAHPIYIYGRSMRTALYSVRCKQD